MGLFNHIIEGVEGDQFTNVAPGSTTKGHLNAIYDLGTLMVFPDGRRFRYVQAGASALAPGKLYQRTVPGANYDELAVPSAYAVGDTTVTVTNGATAITLNQFAQGYLSVEDDTGEGHLYKIKSNTADAATGQTVTLVLESPKGLRVAWTTATTVGLTESPYYKVIVHPSPPTAPLVGVAVDATTALYYGWVQVGGVCTVLCDTACTLAKAVMASTSVDGSVILYTTGGDDEEIVGICVENAADTEYGLVDLRLTS